MVADFPRVIKSREQGRSHNVFHDLASEVILHHFYSIPLFTKVRLIQCGRGLDKGMNTRGVGITGVSINIKLVTGKNY